MRNTRNALHAAVLFAAFAALTLALSAESFGQGSALKKEPELISILQSDKPEAEKAIACKQLSVVGSSKAVPELAKLLANEHLASWARIPLEAIPGPAADEALREATVSLEGRLLVGVLNSIGVRRDAGAVKLLAGRLEDKDVEVASAAAVALGKIGNAEAIEPLRKALPRDPLTFRSAVAEGCILCAERFLADGNGKEATKIYDEVRAAEVPRQRMLEATRGAILARGKDGIPLLVEQLRSDDKGLFQVGLFAAREFPGGDVDKALAAELERGFPERAALIILAMADRPETVDLPAVLKAVGSGQPQVRLAAIGALGRIGNATCLVPLLEIAVEAEAESAAAAKEALSNLPGEGVDQEIVARLAKAEGKSHVLLIELVGGRQIEATSALVAALKSTDKAVRSAALKSLGDTVSQKQFSVLVTQVVSPTSSEDGAAAQKALKTAAIRMPDREACASDLAAALERSSAATKVVLLETLGAVGGTKALAAVGGAAKSNDPALQDAGSRLLGDWSSADAAPVLLGLAKGGGKFQTRALRGYIGMALKMAMPEQQRVEMCKTALETAKQPAEQKLVLDVLKRYPNLEMLKLAVQTMQVPELKKDATEAALAIAQKVPKTNEVKAILTKAGLDK